MKRWNQRNKTLGIMKALLFLILLLSVPFSTQAQQDTMIFYSSKEFNEYRFSNSDLPSITSGFLLDLEEEWTSADIDSFFILQQNDTSNVDFLLSFMNLIERTDVRFQFEKDSVLFPTLDHYMSIKGDREVRIPLFIMDMWFERLSSSKRSIIDTWTSQDPYPQFGSNDLLKNNVNCVSIFADTMEHDDLNIYWNETTFISNTNRSVSKVQISFGSEWMELRKGEFFNVMPYIGSEGVDHFFVKVTYSDSTVKETKVKAVLKKSKEPIVLEQKDGYGGWHSDVITGWDHHDLIYTVYYGCGERNRLNKPFILVAGWGPFTGNDAVNDAQGWPSTEDELYISWNQAGFIDNLRAVGYDVIIARFLPPNDDIRKNAQKLEQLINWVNDTKFNLQSYEENIILGYSAGSMAVRLTLETMEHRHLNYQGPNPHTKLYVSYDGEHAGANIPLATQHSVQYLETFLYPVYSTHIIDNYLVSNTALTMYTLHYILNAPLSKQLLKYFYSQTGNSQPPHQGPHFLRTEYLWEYSYKNHEKNTHLPNYPSFNRNISISNGMSESNITGITSGHHPFPSEEGFVPFKQNNPNRKWYSSFNKSGGNTVFQYKWKPLIGSWQVHLEGATNWDCLVLDNAPGGTVFLPKKQNPLFSVVDMLDKAILGNPEIIKPNTQFSFTPTVLTHDIRNFDASQHNFRMEYSMTQNRLMFQSLAEYEIYLDNPDEYDDFSDYWGYPHITYPNSHYWEVTPFDAVFTWSENTEHILFNRADRSDPNDYDEPWQRVFTSTSGVVKNFILDEADYYNAFIQNKRYGWNARDNYVYKADIRVPSSILVGKEVTQRTNFKNVEFWDNSDMLLRAGKEISLMPGTHVQAGAEFHAQIGPYDCTLIKSSQVIIESEDSDNDDLTNGNKMGREQESPFVLYPNPSSGEVNIRHEANQLGFAYVIYTMQGAELMRGESTDKVTTFHVQQGLYIVKLYDYEKTYSYKVIVR